MSASGFFNPKTTSNRCRSLLLAAAAVGVSLLAMPGKVSAATYYVSPFSAGSSTQDGKTWATAWTSPSVISWSKIVAGDTIKIDGGSSGMRYDGTMQIGCDGTASQPITVEVAPDAGHNGFVLIYADYTGSPVINVGNHKYINIQGQTWKSLQVYGYTGIGVAVGPQATNVNLKNMEVNSGDWGPTTTGLDLRGSYINCSQMTIHDNAVNAQLSIAPGLISPVFQRCWIYNSWWQGLGSELGVKVNNVTSGSGFSSWMFFNNSVFGPGLSTAIQFNQTKGALTANNCLFIDPAVTDIALNDPSSQVYLSNVTSFLAPLNFQNQGHSCLNLIANWPQSGVTRSIFYGGAVQIAGNTLQVGSLNYQFHTTGNTMALGTGQTDPKFITNVSGIPSTATPDQFFNVNLGLQPTSPVPSYIGSQVTSVQQLMSTNQ